MAAETYRAREVYRYYQPRNLTESPEHHDNPSLFSIPHPPLSKKGNFKTQQSFSDTALTAFAQLIALRLRCQRAIVSLIDHENEYFLAESTSTLSLLDGDGPAQNAWLSISGARVPRAESLCESTLSLEPNQDTTAEMTPVFFVPDLRLNEAMCNMDCVKKWDLRFYCGVALTNQSGINIGCVYVVDDKPRDEFSLEEAQFLTTMAATVMDHLENIRAKEDVVRVTMMSQALHAFIEGDGTMDGDWQRLRRYDLPSGAGVGFSWETNKNDGSGLYARKKALVTAVTSGPKSLLKPYGDKITKEGQSPLQHGSGQDARFNFNNSPWSSSSETAQILPLRSVFDTTNTPIAGGRDTEFSNNGFSNLLKSTFSRASNLVREGMEVDGAVYFDAPFRFYQGRSTLETDTRVVQKKGHESSSESGDEEFLETRPGPSPYSKRQRSSHGRQASSSSIDKDPLLLKSDVLGYSTKSSSSWDNQTMDPQTNFTAIDQSLLTSLVRRYPKGELFVFDKNGPISASVEARRAGGSDNTITPVTLEGGRTARRKERKQAEILRLLLAFPGARQIFFVPLYDSTSGCFIGSFAWSTSATRIFSIENHLSYLIAFGHSVMSEVSRLNTLSADRAKGDFISNVSHELRSPLHGILASVEFLADSSLDGFQRNLVDTVDICGRTLLDTIEHVLDFSKIKKFGADTLQPMGTVADLDVSGVIEEVLEGVFAGFEFNGLSSEGLADTTQRRVKNTSQMSSPTEDLQSEFSYDPLTVILDIDFLPNWRFPTVPGTWRRLTMNLFGNALKYTPSGYIKIKLEARTIPPETPNLAGAEPRTMVTLTVTDSGKGMTADFLQTKLFMPFSQEDVTAPGTGLGMSIVKQIVDLSGGTIDIRSELGKGTEVKLSLPLDNCIVKPEDKLAKSTDSFDTEDPIDALRRRARGRTVTIRGFDSALGDSDLRIAALSSLKASIVKYVTEWFDLTIVSNEHIADIVISDESAFLTSTVNQENKFRSQLILCSNGARRNIYMSRLEAGQTVEFVSKPCGPHRIAKALLNCLDTEEALITAGLEQRVSSNLNASHNEGVSKKKTKNEAMVTAGISSNSRLIGDLQSSIGFSPSAGYIKRSEPYYNTEASARARGRPSIKHRLSSGNVPKLQQVDSMDSTSTAASGDYFDASPNGETPASSVTSPVKVDQTLPNAEAPRKPRMLLVEDNPVNMMLLATYMKKNGWEFEKAENGLVALQAFKGRPEGFDVIFMDVSMPIMTGFESTRAIRAVESARSDAYEFQQHSQSNTPFTAPLIAPSTKNSEHLNAMKLHLHASELRANSPALIIALTGFSSQQDQETAFECGVDVFMTKPVRFREVGRILDGWMKSRELESKRLASGVGLGVDIGRQKSGLESGEDMNGIIQSG